MATAEEAYGGLPDPATLTGAYGSAMGQRAGVNSPFFYDAMASIPTATMTTAWNMRRVSNTIIRNKTSRFGSGGRGIRQTFSPRRFGSLANVENIDPGIGSARYTPFNFLSRMGNAAFAEGTKTNAMLGRVGAQSVMNRMTGLEGALPEGTRAFAPGTLGRLAAAGRAGGARGLANSANILESVGRLDSASAQAARMAQMVNPSVMGMGALDERQILKSAVGRTNTGMISGRVTGWIHGAEAFNRGDEAVRAARLVGAGAEHYAGGLEKGIAFAQKSGVIGRVAGSGIISGAARVAGPIGTALMVRDLTMFAGRTLGRGVKLGIEGLASAQGSLINPGPFGMGYKDNSVAATSRQRGVMAISNSRMNARSFLGNEASSMYQMMG